MIDLDKGLCWWFGCKADGVDLPCERCGEPVDYGDLVGDTRHRWFVAWLSYWLFRRWWPERCRDCGKRFGEHKDCLPF